MERDETSAPKSGFFDENTSQALKRFQEFNQLPITGELDGATLDPSSFFSYRKRGETEKTNYI